MNPHRDFDITIAVNYGTTIAKDDTLFWVKIANVNKL